MGLLRCFTRHISRPNLPAPRAKRANQTACVGPPLSPEVIASVEESRRSLEAMRPTYPEYAHSEPYRLPEIVENPQIPSRRTSLSPLPSPTSTINITPPIERSRTPIIMRGPQRSAPESISMPVLPRTHFEPMSKTKRRSNEAEISYHKISNSSSLLQRAKAWKKRNNRRGRVEKSPAVKAAIAHTRRLRRDNRGDGDSTIQSSSPSRRRERRSSMDVSVLRKLSDITAKRRASDLSPRTPYNRGSGGGSNNVVTEDVSPLRRSFEMARKSIEKARKSMEKKSNRMSVDCVPSCVTPRPVNAHIEDEQLEDRLNLLHSNEDLDEDDSQTEEIDVVSSKHEDLPSMDSCSVSYAPGNDDNCSMMSDYPVSLDITRVSRNQFGYNRAVIEPFLRPYDGNRDSIATEQSYSYGFERQEKHSSQERNSYGLSMNSFDMCESSSSTRNDDDEIDNLRRYEDSDVNHEYGSDDDYRTARGGLDEEEEEFRSVVRSISSELTASTSSDDGTITHVELPPPICLRLRRTDSWVALPPRRRADRVTTNSAITHIPIAPKPIRTCAPVRMTADRELSNRFSR